MRWRGRWLTTGCPLVTGQTEGLKVGCIGMGGWVGCGGMGGLQKLITDLDMRYGYKGGV